MHWNQAEKELLQAAPLPRSQLLGYRLTTIGIATAAKSMCFVIVMLPDVRYTLPALFGIFCALLFVDLLRISFETFAYGIPAKARSQFRWTVLTLAGLCIVYATANCVFTADIIRANEPPEPLATIFRFGRGCQELLETGIGHRFRQIRARATGNEAELTFYDNYPFVIKNWIFIAFVLLYAFLFW